MGIELWSKRCRDGSVVLSVLLDPFRFFARMPFPDEINPHFFDINLVGNVYVLVFKRRAIHRKVAHHAILVDVADTSTGSTLNGVILHLVAVPPTKSTHFEAGDQPGKRKDCFETILVGRLFPRTMNPRSWASDLKHEVRCNLPSGLNTFPSYLLLNDRGP